MRKVCFKLVQHCKRKQTTSQSKRNNTASRKLKSHGLDGGYLDLNKWTASASAIEQCAFFEASEHSGITRCLCHLEWHWSSECHDCHMFPWKKRSTLPPRLQKKRWRPAGIQHDNPMQTYAHDKTCKDPWRYVKTNDDKLNCNDSAQSHCHDKLDTSQPRQIETFPAPVWSSKAPSCSFQRFQFGDQRFCDTSRFDEPTYSTLFDNFCKLHLENQGKINKKSISFNFMNLFCLSFTFRSPLFQNTSFTSPYFTLHPSSFTSHFSHFSLSFASFNLSDVCFFEANPGRQKKELTRDVFHDSYDSWRVQTRCSRDRHGCAPRCRRRVQRVVQSLRPHLTDLLSAQPSCPPPKENGKTRNLLNKNYRNLLQSQARRSIELSFLSFACLFASYT